MTAVSGGVPGVPQGVGRQVTGEGLGFIGLLRAAADLIAFAIDCRIDLVTPPFRWSLANASYCLLMSFGNGQRERPFQRLVKERRGQSMVRIRPFRFQLPDSETRRGNYGPKLPTAGVRW